MTSTFTDKLAIQPKQWLDDTCINFCFRLLDEQINATQQFNNILLLDPALVSFLCLQVDDEEEYLALSNGQKFSEFEWLLFPVSDRSSFTRQGSHWSRLLLHQPSMTSYHLDSSDSYNHAAATNLLHAVAKFMNHQNASSLPMETISCPQQGNGYDCGVYTILFAEAMSLYLSSYKFSNVNDCKEFMEKIFRSSYEINHSVVTEYRIKIYEIIERMSREAIAK